VIPCSKSRLQRYLALCCAVVCWLSVAPPAFSSQLKTACELVTKGNVESVFGEAFEEPISSSPKAGAEVVLSSCEFRRRGEFARPGRRIILTLSRVPVADPNALSGRYGQDPRFSFRNIPSVGDAAYWAYARPLGSNPSYGSLDIFQSGTTLLSVTSFGFVDEAAELEKAKKLAFVALGGSGKTGYVYAPPGKAPQPSQNPQTAAGSSQGSKGSAQTQEQFLSGAETLRGLKAFSVAVVSDDIKTEAIKNRVSQALRNHGIAILADGAFPRILIFISTSSMSVNSSTRGGFNVPVPVVAFSLTFEVERPIPVGAKSMLVSTNLNSILGISGALAVNGEVQTAVDTVLKTFFGDYDAR